MNNLKFRVWYEGDNEYKEVHSINFYKQTVDLIEGYYNNAPVISSLLFEEVIIEQYTGINDANDVEIYEGDIVKYIYDELPMGHYREVEVTGVVTWGVLGYGLRIIGSHKPDIIFSDLNFDIEDYHFEENEYYPLDEMQILSEDLEVIGNIHENKELLNG